MKYNLQTTDTTIIKTPNTGGYLLQQGTIICNQKNNTGKIQNFIKSTKTNSPSSQTGATFLPAIGDSFVYFETSFNNHGSNVFCSFE